MTQDANSNEIKQILFISADLLRKNIAQLIM